MMKRLSLTLTFGLLIFSTVRSQIMEQITDPSNMTLGTLFRNYIFPIENYSNIKGTPWFLDTAFTNCVLYLRDGRKFAYNKMRMDLYANKIHFLNKDNVEMVVDDNTVKRIVFLKQGKDTVAGFGFSCDYPSVAKNTPLTYYLEINTGKAQVLEYLYKDIGYSQGVTGLAPEKQFEEHKDYFVYNRNHMKMERLRKNREFVLAFLNDKREEVSKYISDNKLTCKSIADIVKVFDYYNGLK